MNRYIIGNENTFIAVDPDGEWASYEDVEKRDALVREPLEDVLRELEREDFDSSYTINPIFWIKKALAALDGGGTE